MRSGHDVGELGGRRSRRCRRCRSAGSATPASAASTAPTACASSAGPRRSPGSGSAQPIALTSFDRKPASVDLLVKAITADPRPPRRLAREPSSTADGTSPAVEHAERTSSAAEWPGPSGSRCWPAAGCPPPQALFDRVGVGVGHALRRPGLRRRRRHAGAGPAGRAATACVVGVDHGRGRSSTVAREAAAEEGLTHVRFRAVSTSTTGPSRTRTTSCTAATCCST